MGAGRGGSLPAAGCTYGSDHAVGAGCDGEHVVGSRGEGGGDDRVDVSGPAER